MKKIMKNQIITVNHIIGETASAVLEELGRHKYRFTCDAYIDDSDEIRRGVFKHLRQALPVRKGRVVDGVRYWPRLRCALHAAGMAPVNVPGGATPLHYADEIAVADYATSGSCYFVIPRKEIGKYLDQLPLDEQGIARRRRQEEKALEAWLESRDPDCIAKEIGNQFYSWLSCLESGEFVRLTVVLDSGLQKSVIYNYGKTDLFWEGCVNTPKLLCAAPEETGIEYLSRKAAPIDPGEHHRIKKGWDDGWSRHVAYLAPNPNLADFVGEWGWYRLFSTVSADHPISHREIADAKRIILEKFSLEDKLLPGKLVYDKYTNEVTTQYA